MACYSVALWDCRVLGSLCRIGRELFIHTWRVACLDECESRGGSWAVENHLQEMNSGSRCFLRMSLSVEDNFYCVDRLVYTISSRKRCSPIPNTFAQSSPWSSPNLYHCVDSAHLSFISRWLFQTRSSHLIVFWMPFLHSFNLGQAFLELVPVVHDDLRPVAD